MDNNEEVKTKFQGPGEWHSQAKKLEETEEETPEE